MSKFEFKGTPGPWIIETYEGREHWEEELYKVADDLNWSHWEYLGFDKYNAYFEDRYEVDREAYRKIYFSPVMITEDYKFDELKCLDFWIRVWSNARHPHWSGYHLWLQKKKESVQNKRSDTKCFEEYVPKEYEGVYDVVNRETDHEVWDIATVHYSEQNAKLIIESPEMFNLLSEVVHGLDDKDKLTLWEQSVKHSAEQILNRITNQK